MKDLFVGASGRLNNHGGSRMFTTPHTINVPPEYTVETDVPSVAEFVTCSLDGRLLVYRRSRRFYVAAFRWNEDTQRLVFVGTTILSNEAFVMRGADWILTDKSLIQSLDDEPYISRTTYTDSSFLDTINKSYSFFPEIETWQKIQGEQILTIQDSPYEQWQDLPQSLITPLEFHYYSQNDIKAFTEFSPQLCYCNGQLYGKGKAHIGRAYLLPRTFSEDGEPEDFYLYISPDYLRTYNGSFDDNDGWENLRVAPFTPESVAIFTPQNDDYSICKKATNAQIITLPNGESLDLSADNGALFFDAFTGSNLALNDNGASLLRDGLNFECKGLQQWITPSGKVDTISPQLVMSSFDNGTLATHIQGGFHRELLAGKTLPLSVRDYSGKRLSLGESQISNGNSVQINELTSTPLPHNDERAMWEDLYKPFIDSDVITESRYNFNLWHLPHSMDYSPDTIYDYVDYWNFFIYWKKHYAYNNIWSIFWLGEYPICCYDIDSKSFRLNSTRLGDNYVFMPATIDYDTHKNIDIRNIAVNSQFSASFHFYVPATKEFKVFNYTWDLSSYVSNIWDDKYVEMIEQPVIGQSEFPEAIGPIYAIENMIIQEGKIGLVLGIFEYRRLDSGLRRVEWADVYSENGHRYVIDGIYLFPRYTYGEYIIEENYTIDEAGRYHLGQTPFYYIRKKRKIFVPGCDIPEEIADWQLSTENISCYESEGYSYVSLPFHESITDTLFIMKTSISSETNFDCASFINKKTSTSTVHIIDKGYPSNNISIYHIDFHPEIFDFNAEIERSKLF